MARPKSDNPMIKLTIFLPPDVKERLHAVADAYGLKDSHLARIFIQYSIDDFDHDRGQTLKKFLTFKNT